MLNFRWKSDTLIGRDHSLYRKFNMLRLMIFVFGSCLTLNVSAKELPPLPKAVSSMGAVESEGYLYVYGGHSGKTHVYDNKSTLGTFQRLDLKEPKGWETLPSGPNLQGLNLAAYEGKIYRVGGMMPRNEVGEAADMLSVKTCACYDPKAGRWEALPDLPEGRSSHDLAVVGKTLFVVGGWNSQGKGQKTTWHDTILTLNLAEAGAKWQSISQPFQRRAIGVAAIQSKLYVFGGLTADGTSERAVNILDTATGKWSEAAKLPGKTARVGFSPAAIALNGKLIVNTLEGTVYRLADDDKAWEEVAQAKQRRLVQRIVPYQAGQILIVGGTVSGEPLASLEVLQLAAKGTPVKDGE
jgi:hypothetical protein